jgi:hypothetical protein
MTKVVTAEYDAEQNTLRLDEPLEGVRDHEKVQVHVVAGEEPPEKKGISSLDGILSAEAGEELSRLVNEMFPPWD